MLPPDPRDDAFAEVAVAALVGMIRAYHHGDSLRLIGELNLLLTAIVEHDKTLREHPHNAALRQAVERMWR